ncbi:hypothetical protein [Promicromonospora sp. NPDC050880]|uniref:hypothetical protein n=1 Tax=Promicromonospora sp. NPDC050880 TaxID=3364406 RepID=UPI003793F9E9
MAGTTTGSRWPIGEPEIQNLLDEGELQLVAPSEEHSGFLLDQADVHLASAAKLVDDDPSRALAMLYDAARKAMTAPLARQGLRLRRHDSEYPGVETPTITSEEVTLALADAREIVDAMKVFVPNVGPWR